MLRTLLPSDPNWLPCETKHLPRISFFWSQFPSTSWTKPCDAPQTTQDSVAIMCNLEPSSTHHSGQRHERGVLSWVLLYVIIALLPKDGAALGGERPIGLLPIIVRILDRLFYGELSAWCDSAHGFWDRAIANCSGPRSANHTILMMETVHIMGISAGILFIDPQKFYDSVDLVLLIKACNGLEYPWIPLLLLGQAFFGSSHVES